MDKPTTTEAHNAAAAGEPITTSDPPRLLTKQMMEDLKEQLSEPALVSEITPEGSIVKEVRTEHDQRITAEIAHIQRELDKRHNLARNDFNKATDGWKGSNLKR